MSARPLLTLVAVVSADGFISTGTGVPWALPRDKAHFRRVTRGQWLLIGRRTYEEMIGWFRDHHPLVLTRDRDFKPPVGQRVGSVAEALRIVGQAGAHELVVVGGSGPFDAAMPMADRLIMTEVADVLGSGVPFPAIAPDQWHVVSRQTFPPDAENAYGMAIVTYERRHPGQDRPPDSLSENSR
ncbi:MAG: dihydrofolate reductase [Prosthecobacter sp.]|uniref:dihydrofolate reductase n=1 Tax=Prosthecobacter sp. TaxID=1965333 RepID=UPI0038FF4BC4